MNGNQTRKLSNKYDDLYARAWECEYDKPIFDSDYNILVSPDSLEITVRSDEAADEMRSTPGTIERIPQKLSLRQTDCMTERTDIIPAAWCGY